MIVRRVAFVCVLAVAACGGSDSSGGDGQGGGESFGPPATEGQATLPVGLSKAEFITAADKLCLDFNTRAGALPEPQSQQEFVQLLDKAIALAEETRTSFDALQPPDDGQAVKQALVASLTESTDRVHDARDAAARGDQAAVDSAMADAQKIGKRSDPEAKAYGFKVCGSEDELPDT